MTAYASKIDTQTDGTRYDVTPILSDPQAFDSLINDLASPFDEMVDVVVGLDAIGFILGSAVAMRMGIAFVPVRKSGKLPVPTYRETFVDYSGSEKALEIRTDAFTGIQRILIVDDWIETGAQMTATLGLLGNFEVSIVGISVVHAERNAATEDLFETYTINSAVSSVP